MVSEGAMGDMGSPPRTWQEIAVAAPPSHLERVFDVTFEPWSRGVLARSAPRLAGVDGLPVGGWGPALDGALGRAVRAVLPPESTLRTIDLRVDMLPGRPGRPPRPHGRVPAVEVRAEPLACDERTGVSRGEIRVDGVLAAVATGHFAVVEEASMADAGEVRDVGECSEGSVLGVLGWGLVSPVADGVDVEVRPSRDAANDYGIMHGGGQVLLVDVVLEATLRQVRPGCDLVDLTVEYRRPVPVDGSCCRALGRVTRSGRLVQQVEVHLEGGDGALLVVGRGVYSTPPS